MLQKHLASLGISVSRVKNNLWAESEPAGSKPTVMLNAHIDTVKPSASWKSDPLVPLKSTYADGRTAICGLGSNDDGGSVVALTDAFLRLCASPQPCRFILALTSEEENCGRNGIEALVAEIGEPDLAIVGEPTGMKMAVAEKGLMVLDCSVAGVAGHAAREEGVNAIYKALPAIEWFRTYRFAKVSEFLGPVKMNVTQVNAGTQHNVIPDICSFVVDVRGNGLCSNEDILSEIESSVPAGCSVKARSTRLSSSSISLDNPAVKRGVSMGLETFGSPTLSNQALLHCPCIKMGPGDSARSHSAGEYILLEEIIEGADIYFRLLNGIEL